MSQIYAFPHHIDLYVEDFLKDRGVFDNFISPGSSNPGSYMSYIVYAKWDGCKMELLDAFGSLALRKASEILGGWEHLSPIFPHLAFLINQLLKNHPDHLPTHPENMGDPDITTLQIIRR